MFLSNSKPQTFFFPLVQIDLEEYQKEWLATNGPEHIKKIAEHYGVYEHLFGDAYFYPLVHLDAAFDVGNGEVPVCYGNVIKPKEAQNKPKISYNSDENTLWTLILTNPDGHFTEQNMEYVHWFV